MSHRVFLCLGSNLGDRAANLASARAALASKARLIAASPIYETPPWGYPDQPPFLDQVVEIETELSPEELLTYVKWIEVQLGRLPSIRYGPRRIDVDILLYDDLVLDTPTLTIPHPRMTERAFVLVPLADLAADLIHPTQGKTIQELLEAVDKTGIMPYQG